MSSTSRDGLLAEQFEQAMDAMTEAMLYCWTSPNREAHFHPIRSCPAVSAARQALLDRYAALLESNNYLAQQLRVSEESERLALRNNEALRQDRERLDWLETEAISAVIRHSAERPRGDVISLDRAAIDAARQAGRGAEECR